MFTESIGIWVLILGLILLSGITIFCFLTNFKSNSSDDDQDEENSQYNMTTDNFAESDHFDQSYVL